MRWIGGIGVGIALAGLVPASGWSQATETSELWREWAVLNRMIDDAQEEAERARRAALTRRQERAADAPDREPPDR